MGRGFLAGIFWGGLIGLFLVVLSNQVMDRRVLSFPQPDAAPVEVPAGTEFDQAREETDPVAPQGDTRPGGEAVVGVQAPEELTETPPSFDTSSLEMPTPEVDAGDTLGEAPEPASEPEINVTGPQDSTVADDAPAMPAPDAPTSAPATVVDAPAATVEPEAESEGSDAPVVTEDAAPEGEDVVASLDAPAADTAGVDAVVPDAGPAPAPVIAPEAAPSPDVGDAPSGVVLPETDDGQIAGVRPDGGESQFFQPVDQMGDQAPNVQTDRLPRVEPEQQAAETEEAPEVPEATDEVASEEAADQPRTLPTVRRLGQSNSGPEEAPVADEAPESTDRAEATGRAIVDWRMAFESTSDAPLIGLVLVHETGSSVQDVARAAPATVAIAVRASDADAAEVARAYRDAGREVVLIPALPVDATPQDVEVALQANFAAIPEAVAVMDSDGGDTQADRDAVAQVVDVIAATGHGLVTFPRGLNTAYQQAERNGVPAGLVFRDIDGTGQSSAQIQRALDRAAFRAGQEDGLVLVGRTSGETLSALAEWALGSRAQSVTVAPISRVLAGE